jgi:hypothetical protein
MMMQWCDRTLVERSLSINTSTSRFSETSQLNLITKEQKHLEDLYIAAVNFTPKLKIFSPNEYGTFSECQIRIYDDTK